MLIRPRPLYCRSPRPVKATGAEILVSTLEANGVETVFCVPGESYLPVLDALYEARQAIRTVSCRHEGGASYMAEAYAKLTNHVGVCLVSRGPGAANASIGVHVARQDSTPMLLLVGQIPRRHRYRDAFQELDCTATFASLAKAVYEVDSAERVAEIVARALHVACSGRRGPVVVSLHEDVLWDLSAATACPVRRGVRVRPSSQSLTRVHAMLCDSLRPLIIAGGGGWSASGVIALTEVAERYGAPVITAFRRKDLIDNQHPLYAGDAGFGINARLVNRIEQSDTILAIGCRFDEPTSNDYTLFNHPQPKQQLIHVHPDAETLNQVYAAAMPICADPSAFIEALAVYRVDREPSPSPTWVEAARADYLSYSTPPEGRAQPMDQAVIFSRLSRSVPANTILTSGAGNYTSWALRYYRHRMHGTLIAPIAGAMGYGIPAAISAKLVHPDRPVIALAGDGCFLMNSQELATAAMYDLPIIVLLFNNGMYGTIRMHQEMHYPGRIIGTSLSNPDFELYGRSFAARTYRPKHSEESVENVMEAIARRELSLVIVDVDAERLTPDRHLSESYVPGTPTPVEGYPVNDQ